MNAVIVDPLGAVRNGNKTIKRSLPIGTITIRKRKQANGKKPFARYIKIRLDGPIQDRWKLYARWWWEQNRGAVPPGHVVYHVDGSELNDAPGNLAVGTFGEKFVAAHRRDPEMSRRNHQEIGRLRATMNREQARIYRTQNFIKNYWYPVVDDLSVILNVPFRRRKRLLACFGVNVRNYPANGVGKQKHSEVQRALAGACIKPVRSHELSDRKYMSYCFLEPDTRNARGPRSTSIDRLIVQLDRMEIWKYAEKQAKRAPRERK